MKKFIFLSLIFTLNKSLYAQMPFSPNQKAQFGDVWADYLLAALDLMSAMAATDENKKPFDLGIQNKNNNNDNELKELFQRRLSQLTQENSSNEKKKSINERFLNNKFTYIPAIEKQYNFLGQLSNSTKLFLYQQQLFSRHEEVNIVKEVSHTIMFSKSN